MPAFQLEVRASATDWQRIATCAIRARAPIGQHAAALLTAAADADLPGNPDAKPFPDVRKYPVTFPDHATFAAVQAWRSRAGLTWPQAVRAAANATP